MKGNHAKLNKWNTFENEVNVFTLALEKRIKSSDILLQFPKYFKSVCLSLCAVSILVQNVSVWQKTSLVDADDDAVTW